jgi:hypothetical protein
LLKSFLGVAVYFHEHIRNFATLAHPLHQMIHNYDKSKAQRLQWTEERVAAFQTLKQSINELPLLFCLDEISPVYLMTDASEYGIGAYLYQLREGREFPIAFMSKRSTHARADGAPSRRSAMPSSALYANFGIC